MADAALLNYYLGINTMNLFSTIGRAIAQSKRMGVSRIVGVILIASVAHGSIGKAQTISTLAGDGMKGYSGDGGPAALARLYYAEGVAIDAAGNLYIADTYNDRIRKVTPQGIISTVVGNGSQGYSGDGGPATLAQLSYPKAVAFDAAGNLYIADFDNNRIRKVTAGTGVITTFAGKGTWGYSGDGGLATNAQLYHPNDIAFDGVGNLYIADMANHRIRKVDTSGMITTVAGIGMPGYSGDGGLALSAMLQYPSNVALDAKGDLYIVDSSNNRIRKVTAGMINTIAGSSTVAGYGGDGGPATSAKLSLPNDIVFDSNGILYIADSLNHRIRAVDPSGIISTVAGSAANGYGGDGGPATSAKLYEPKGIAVDAEENLYIADFNNLRIRQVNNPPVVLLTGAGAPLTYGNPIALVASVAGNFVLATGVVNFFDGSSLLCGTVPLDSEMAKCATEGLSVGNHSLNAVYGGDGVYPASTGYLSLTVAKADTHAEILAIDPITSRPGQKVKVTIAVEADSAMKPQGLVTISDTVGKCDAQLDSNGSGSCTLDKGAIKPGTYTVTALYSGNGNFEASEAPEASRSVKLKP